VVLVVEAMTMVEKMTVQEVAEEQEAPYS